MADKIEIQLDRIATALEALAKPDMAEWARKSALLSEKVVTLGDRSIVTRQFGPPGGEMNAIEGYIADRVEPDQLSEFRATVWLHDGRLCWSDLYVGDLKGPHLRLTPLRRPTVPQTPPGECDDITVNPDTGAYECPHPEHWVQ